jgi:hypothetical protein
MEEETKKLMPESFDYKITKLKPLDGSLQGFRADLRLNCKNKDELLSWTSIQG